MKSILLVLLFFVGLVSAFQLEEESLGESGLELFKRKSKKSKGSKKKGNGSKKKGKGSKSGAREAASGGSGGNSGTATYYGYKDSAKPPVEGSPGACGNKYNAKESGGKLYYAAINSGDYNSGLCGKTVTVTCNSGSCKGKTTKAIINDECPTCSKGGIDLSMDNFAELAGSVSEGERLGVLDVQWSVSG